MRTKKRKQRRDGIPLLEETGPSEEMMIAAHIREEIRTFGIDRVRGL